MSRILYFDCFSGISGDMLLGAMLDAGLPLTDLTAAIGETVLANVDLTATRVLRAGVSATKFDVREKENGAPRTPRHNDGHEHEHDHHERSTHRRSPA